MMFTEWSSDLLPQQSWLGDEAAISAFKTAVPWKVSRDFVAGTAKHLAGSLGGLSKPPSGSSTVSPLQRSTITNDKQLGIIMPALGYGLSFPLSEVDVLRDCVTVYCDWLTAFLPVPKPSVPQPIIDDPNHYAAIIISHFYYVFVPRGGEGTDVNKQAVLCHRVLRTLQTVAQNSARVTEETWHTLLLFLLHINAALLSPPTVKVNTVIETISTPPSASPPQPPAAVPSASSTASVRMNRATPPPAPKQPHRDDAGEQLCERVLSVLFETWLLACDKCFPPPPLWTALRQGCVEWRHRAGLVQQWGRVCCALTARLLAFMYGPDYACGLATADELSVIPATMTRDCTAQVWFRLLHVLGNPVELSRQHIISKTPAFLQFAIASQAVVEPCQHPCLSALPSIFLAAMKVVAQLADAFLGPDDSASCSVAGRPKVNSVLHLFGPWLFEAALVGADLAASPTSYPKSETASSVSGVPAPAPPPAAGGASAKRPPSLYGLTTTDTRKISGESTASGGGGGPALSGGGEKLASLTFVDFEAGRAEALGALCRIMCSAKTGEEILPVYLARFYVAAREGLRAPLPPATPAPAPHTPTTDVPIRKNTLGPKSAPSLPPPCSASAAAVLLHGSDLFRTDLDGAVTLLPAVLPVLAAVLADRTPRDDRRGEDAAGPGTVALRRAATHILLSLLPLPLHFQDLTVKEVSAGGERHRLSSLRPQLLNLLSVALQTEVNPHTTHMLLGGLLFCVQDATACEAMDSVSQHSYPLPDARDTPLGPESCSSAGGGMELGSLTEEEGFENEDLDAGVLPLSLGSSSNECCSLLAVRALYLVCHHLIATWRTDVNVSLAGLELLAGLARLQAPQHDWVECKRAVKWLCDYIVYQCSRPPQAHSKDLHSTIVAAFQTCGTWLLSQPSLLQDPDCLSTVLEVIELGISGSKSAAPSRGKGGHVLKQDKPLKPASLRVRDAAEALLSCALSQVGRFPAGCGAELVSSQLDEATLLQHSNAWRGEEAGGEAVAHFRYYVSQNSILLALLEQPLGNHQEPQPRATAIVRGPFGRSVWALQLRHLPRHRAAAATHTSANPGRPLPATRTAITPPPPPHYFPDSVDRIPQCKADKSIPSLDAVIHRSEQSSADHEKLLQILDHQVAFEEQLEEQAITAGEDDGEGECAAPPVCQEFQTARLLLTHLGLLSVDSLKCGGEGSVPELVALDSSVPGFARELQALDSTNNRTTDTVHVFYVAAGQTTPHEIVGNVSSRSMVSPVFLELLGGLGWSVCVSSHSGWMGRTPLLQQQCRAQQGDVPYDGGGQYCGATQLLYWCDASSEVAFLVPSQLSAAAPPAGAGASLDGDSASAGSDSIATDGGDGDASFSSHASQASGRRYGRQSSAVAGHEHKVLVVWLESFADRHTFPAGALLPECVTGLEAGTRSTAPPPSIIFLHPLESGLFRVHLLAPSSKLSVAGPLVSGQVVSRRALGALVRQTALNMARRRRLDSDSYQPPHVRRRLRIQEMVQRCRYDMTEPEFLSHLFTSPLC